MTLPSTLGHGIKITLKSQFCRKNVINFSLCTQHSGFKILLHGIISLREATSYDI